MNIDSAINKFTRIGMVGWERFSTGNGSNDEYLTIKANDIGLKQNKNKLRLQNPNGSDSPGQVARSESCKQKEETLLHCSCFFSRRTQNKIEKKNPGKSETNIST